MSCSAFDSWLIAQGYDVAALTQTNRKHLEAAYKADTQTVPVATPVVPTAQHAPAETKPKQHTPYELELAAAEKEAERRSQIDALASEQIKANIRYPERLKHFDLMRNAAIEGGWDVTAFKIKMLEAKHTVGPITSIHRGEEVTADILEAAVCMHTGLPKIESHFDERTLDIAHKQYGNSMSLLKLVETGAKQNGWRGHSVKSDMRNALRHAFNGGSQLDFRAEGASTLAISGILSNIANKFLRIAFENVEMAWRGFSAIRPVNDFKTVTTYSLTGDLTYDQVAPGGEIKHGTLGETSYTNKADTYAKMLGIDRRDLINDDLGALSSVSKRLGRGGALKINDIFWSVWLNDSSFFNTDKSKNNYDDGSTDSVLTLAGLENARNIFLQQTDPDGKPLGSMPAILLVPTTLGVTARNLMNGTLTAGAQSTATLTLANVFQNMFRIVESTYLANSSYTGYSTTAWYLLADPNDLPAIELCFLNGNEMPTIETAEMDFDRLGIALRGYHDFGASLQEYRAGVKLKGTT